MRVSSLIPAFSMANSMSFTAPILCSLSTEPSSSTITFSFPSAHSLKRDMNLWFDTTINLSIPDLSPSSRRWSMIFFPPTSRRGLGKLSVKGYILVAYPAASIIPVIRIFLLPPFPLRQRGSRCRPCIFLSGLGTPRGIPFQLFPLFCRFSLRPEGPYSSL